MFPSFREVEFLKELTLSVDLPGFLPELILCGAIVLMLLFRLFSPKRQTHMGVVALAFTVLALVFTGFSWRGAQSVETQTTYLFSRLLVYDNFTLFLRLFLLSSTALTIILTLITRIPDVEDSADFHVLLLGATVGMSIMASASHLLMFYIGVEMASLPSYALAGFLKGRRQSSEASLKYVVYGGGASGIMLYGISLLAGKFGTGYIPDLAYAFSATLHPAAGASLVADPILLLGTLFILIGLAFKLSAVPFHFWCPDVFEGAAAEVAGFLSVASKGAAMALVGRFVLVLSGLDHQRPNYESWIAVVRYLAPALAFFAALTATFGNLAAYVQTNMKRLLAYSTIAHAGYMIMGLATMSRDGAGAVIFYLVVYLFTNLGAFAVIAFLRNQTGSEDLASYRGLVRRSPWMVITLSIFLLSLLGMPPLAGFAAKFQIFRVLYDSGREFASLGEWNLSYTMYGLLAIGGLNTVLSVMYYLKVLKVMIIERSLEEVESGVPTMLAEPVPSCLYAALMSVVVVGLGIFWNPLSVETERGVNRFHASPRPGDDVVAGNAGGGPPVRGNPGGGPPPRPPGGGGPVGPPPGLQGRGPGPGDNAPPRPAGEDRP